jgi:hypothetical protein
MAGPWISHVKSVAQKLGLNYSEALKDPRTKASYRNIVGKVRGGAVRSSDIKHLTNKELKEMLKERGFKLTKKTADGKYKPYTKDEIINILQKDKKKNAKPKTALEKMAYTSAPQQFDDAPASMPSVEEAYRIVSNISELIDNSELPEVEKDDMQSLIALLQKLTGGRRMKGGKFSFSKLAKDTGNISKKILKYGVPALTGAIGTIEGGPAAGLATAKASSALTDYILGGKRRKNK